MPQISARVAFKESSASGAQLGMARRSLKAVGRAHQQAVQVLRAKLFKHRVACNNEGGGTVNSTTGGKRRKWRQGGRQRWWGREGSWLDDERSCIVVIPWPAVDLGYSPGMTALKLLTSKALSACLAVITENGPAFKAIRGNRSSTTLLIAQHGKSH
eukprot:1142862-Pelagomonas_calceolata.AAC.3